METKVLSLVDDHTSNFKTFVKLLIEKFQPQQLFCFAKNVTSDETNGCFVNRRVNQACHYCLLM